MARFCVNCGSALAEGARFCPNCGAATASPAAPAPNVPSPSVPSTPAVAPPDAVIGTPVTNTTYTAPAADTTGYAPSAGSPTFQSAPVPPTPASSLPPITNYAPPAKTSSGVKILFIVLAIFVFLGLLLAGSCFYVAYRVKQKAGEFKAEMGGSAPRYSGSRDACGKMSEAEASQALGQKVTAVESRGSAACIYHFGPGGQKQVPVEYTWQGGVIAMKLSHNLAGAENFTTVPGIGDEAYLAPMNSALLMRKGDVMVNIDMRVAGLNGEAAKAMARKIAANL